jgi:hypothetical protein
MFIMCPSSGTEGLSGDDAIDLDRLVLRKGSIFLLLEERPYLAYQILKRFVDNQRSNEGMAQRGEMEPMGLIMTRQFPPDLKRELDMDDVPIFWLTTNITSKENAISPSAITRLNFIMSEFLQGKMDGIALVDCIEYLITQNSFETILRVIQSWNDRIVGTRKRMILSVDPLTLSIQQLHLIKRETLEIYRTSEGEATTR